MAMDDKRDMSAGRNGRERKVSRRRQRDVDSLLTRGRTRRSAGVSCLASTCIIFTFLASSSPPSSSLSSSSSLLLPLLLVAANEQPRTLTKDKFAGKTRRRYRRERNLRSQDQFGSGDFGEGDRFGGDGFRHGRGGSRQRRTYDRFGSGPSSSGEEIVTRVQTSGRFSETRDEREGHWRGSWTEASPSAETAWTSSSRSEAAPLRFWRAPPSGSKSNKSSKTSSSEATSSSESGTASQGKAKSGKGSNWSWSWSGSRKKISVDIPMMPQPTTSPPTLSAHPTFNANPDHARPGTPSPTVTDDPTHSPIVPPRIDEPVIISSPTDQPSTSHMVGSHEPTASLSHQPSESPSASLSAGPTKAGSHRPSESPSITGSHKQSGSLSFVPSTVPTIHLSTSATPSSSPSSESSSPQSHAPSVVPSVASLFDTPSTEVVTGPPTPLFSDLPFSPDSRIVPLPVTDLKMDLFGLASLSDLDVLRYAEQTARYYEDFYNDNFLRIRESVWGVTASIAVTNQSSPNTPPTSEDCELIDPLTMTFTLDFAYYATEPPPSLEDVIAFPFSRKRSQQRYINTYLKENDVTGGFQDLLCISEVRVPDAEVGAAPMSAPGSSVAPAGGGTGAGLAPGAASGGETGTVPTPVPATEGTDAFLIGVEMDLFGVPTALASPPDKEHYEAATASYVSTFYNEGSKQPDARRVVSNATAFVTMIDQWAPTGNTVGEDCDLIDPLTVTFFLEMTYDLTDPTVTFGEVAATPFGKKRLQKRYMEDYLKVNDATGVFQGLQCIGEIRLLGETGPPVAAPATSMPVPEGLPLSPLLPTDSTDPSLPGGLPTMPSVSVNSTGRPLPAGVPVLPPLPSPVSGPSPSDTGGLPVLPLSNGTGVGTFAAPPPMTGVEMDLFGIASLAPIDRARYAFETASHIEMFYSEDVERVDVREWVSNATASVEVTGEVLPLGNTAGEDCELIDPVTVTLTLEMTYNTLYSDVNFEDVLTSPFAKKRQQKKYIDMLKENDFSGGFQALKCVSELRLPEGEVPGTSPASLSGLDMGMTSPPQVPPLMNASLLTVSENGLGSDEISNGMRMSDPAIYERKCTEEVLAIQQDHMKEFEISFVYGVESSKSDSHVFVDSIETLILDFLATSVLRCSSNNHAVGRVRKTIDGDSSGVGEVVRVRYPNEEQTTSVSCNLASPQAEICVVNTKLLVTITTTSSAPPLLVKVHRDLLAVLQDAFEEDVFVEFVPEIVSTRYLGPDPSAVVMPEAGSDEEKDAGKGSHKAAGLVFSISFAVVVVKLAALAASHKAGNGTKAWEKVVFFYRHKHRHAPRATPQTD